MQYFYQACNYDFLLLFQCILLNFGAFFNTFHLWKIFLIICLCYYLLCRRGNKHFDIHFQLIRHVFFPSKDGKDAVCKGGNGGKVVYFTVARRATSDYVIVPEHFGQNEEPAGSNEERTRKKPSFVPKVDLKDAIVFPSMYL